MQPMQIQAVSRSSETDSLPKAFQKKKGSGVQPLVGLFTLGCPGYQPGDPPLGLGDLSMTVGWVVGAKGGRG